MSRYREFSRERLNDFLRCGYKQRHFFPHRLYYLPKCGPDGYKLVQRMYGEAGLNDIWEIVLYAIAPTVDEFPKELFFNDDVMWHRQQFGVTGQVATANLLLQGQSLYSMVHISDLVQRISRRREFKTRIENRFKGWPYMLLNALLNFATENNIDTICIPRAEFAREHTDKNRHVQEPLFKRVYDRSVNEQLRAKRNGNWWEINVEANKDKIVVPDVKQEKINEEKIICITHDIERGLGHIGIDQAMVDQANKLAPGCLEQMLKIERELKVKATYNVVGCILDEVKEKLERDGHCIAFHSYDHNLETEQLRRCNKIDYRIKGYRTPMSRLTPELAEETLCFHNFEWLASSAKSFGFDKPSMENRIVKIPILFDDFEMYKENTPYELWEKKAISRIKENKFVAFGMHDCYGKFWLPYYDQFLKKIRGLGVLKTMDEVAFETILSCAQ